MPSVPCKPAEASSGGTPPSRRDMLRLGAGGAVIAPMLAACGSTANPDAYVGGQNYDDPRRGGRLRVGVAGGSANDTVDAHLPTDNTDIARVHNLYDPLAYFDADYSIKMALAESIEPNKKATKWTVRLRDGLEFHNGKTITADDVVFSVKRFSDLELGGTGSSALMALDRGSIRKVDERTVELPFTIPMANVLDILAEYYTGIVPEDYDPKNPVGSGAFAFKEFTPGVRSLFTRHPNYWMEGMPYVDELKIIDFADETARVNALIGGQVDAISQLPPSQIKVVESYDSLSVLEAESGSWLPFTMRTDQAPFDDVRVRQAFRLIVDRQQMIDQALSGHGAIGNDIYARFDPVYAEDLPQRKQDIAKAKQLLADAGHADGLSVDLTTGPINAGVVEAAQVFAQQAKAAGVSVNVQRITPSEYFGDNYLKWTFAQDFWGTRNYISQASQCMMPNATLNETHWDDEEWTEIVREARQTVDDGKRAELLHQAQKIDYERGGYILWGFPNLIDGYKSQVKGFTPTVTGHPLSTYGFHRVWFDEDQ